MRDPDNTIVDRNRWEKISARASSVCAASHNQEFSEIRGIWKRAMQLLIGTDVREPAPH